MIHVISVSAEEAIDQKVSFLSPPPLYNVHAGIISLW